MNNQQFMKWAIEVANQEYSGDLKLFLNYIGDY